MSKPRTGRAILVDGKAYRRRSDGSLVPLENRTDYKRLDAMTTAAIESIAAHDRDGPPMTDEEWTAGEIVRPTKVAVGIKLDDDVLDWFKARGRGYQTRINAVLRRYVEAQRKTG
jgi:uncharacterized protein (DUF4415 family)